jgi:regulator of sigma E protease
MIPFMSFFITIFALGFVIFIHELGHMWSAKRFGIGVYEFSIGMGPKVFSKKVDETEYSLRAFPFGGFVKLAGLDEDDGESVEDSLNFKKKPLWQRSVVIAAGSIMNLLLGFLIYSLVFSTQGVPESSATIATVVDGSPAQEAGLMTGDVIQSINQVSLDGKGKNLVEIVSNSKGEELVLAFSREGADKVVSLMPKASGDSFIIGVALEVEYNRLNPFAAIGKGLVITGQQVMLVFKSLGMLFTGGASLKQLTGPIGIVQFASFQFGESLSQFLNVMAMISISLGVINLFPFPVLDGGHLVFLGIEAIRRKPVSQKVEILISNIGAAILITLMVLVVFNDIRFWQFRSDFFKSLMG